MRAIIISASSDFGFPKGQQTLVSNAFEIAKENLHIYCMIKKAFFFTSLIQIDFHMFVVCSKNQLAFFPALHRYESIPLTIIVIIACDLKINGSQCHHINDYANYKLFQLIRNTRDTYCVSLISSRKKEYVADEL